MNAEIFQDTRSIEGTILRGDKDPIERAVSWATISRLRTPPKVLLWVGSHHIPSKKCSCNFFINGSQTSVSSLGVRSPTKASKRADVDKADPNLIVGPRHGSTFGVSKLESRTVVWRWISTLIFRERVKFAGDDQRLNHRSYHSLSALLDEEMPSEIQNYACSHCKTKVSIFWVNATFTWSGSTIQTTGCKGPETRYCSTRKCVRRRLLRNVYVSNLAIRNQEVYVTRIES